MYIYIVRMSVACEHVTRLLYDAIGLGLNIAQNHFSSP